MDTKKNIEKLWNYIDGMFEEDHLEWAMKEFDIAPDRVKPDTIAALNEEEARILLSDLGYMTVNGLLGGDFGTWNEILQNNLKFDKETIDFLDY